MATPSIKDILSLLSREDKSSSLKIDDRKLLCSINPSLATDLSSRLLEYQNSQKPHVRILLIQIIEEIGFKATKHSPQLFYVLSKLLHEGRDVITVKQSIVSGSNLFYSGFNELIVQFKQRGEVEPWLKAIWGWMQKFKESIFKIALEIGQEPGDIATRVLALNFLEMVILLFSPDINDPEKSAMKGIGQAVNISSLSALGEHPVINQNQLMLEANRALGILLSLLQFAFTIGSLPDPLAIALINCSAAIARKRPEHADIILSTMFGFDPKYQIVNEGPSHVARIQRSLITTFLILLERGYSHTKKYQKRMIEKEKDMRKDMIKKGYSFAQPCKDGVLPPHYENETLHHEIDWRKDGVVSSVKQQGNCDSCWAFIAVGSVEGDNGKLCGTPILDLSPQELVDNDRKSHGCSGGWHYTALEYIQSNGITCDIDYPYVVDEVPCESLEKSCRKNQLCRKRRIVTIDGFQKVPVDDNALQEAVRRQPIAVKLRIPVGDTKALFTYGRGQKNKKISKILEGSSYLNKEETRCHGMLLVGFGRSSLGREYWILKNSWGQSWGVDGYLYLLRKKLGKGAYDINQSAYYPIIRG